MFPHYSVFYAVYRYRYQSWVSLWSFGVISPLHFVCGVNQKATLVSHTFLASSCDVVVYQWRLGFLNAVDTVGIGSSLALIFLIWCTLQMMVTLVSYWYVLFRAGRAHTIPISMRNTTWLIMLVLLCLSQRLSHDISQRNKKMTMWVWLEKK